MISSSIASILVLAGIVALFRLDRDSKAKTSPALWIAVVWVAIGASRMVSQWFGSSSYLDSPDQYLEGSPLDRAILAALLIGGLTVLVARGARTGAFLRANAPVVLFFTYCALSALWSDYPFVSFKRWTKGLGNVTMVLIVLTDPEPRAALKRLLSRTGFLLIPVSVLLIKYYPAMGRGYSRWTWEPFFTGAATEKNALGAICLVFGLGALWRLIEVFRDKTATNRLGSLAANGIIVGMTLWLFAMSDSATSIACFALGGALMAILSGSKGPARVHVAVAAMICVAVIGYVFQDAYASMVQALGRDTTLTGRTDIWADLFAMDLNPWFGTGFETFWLGERAEFFWNKYYFHPNQAHNGYIETYINLGWIGVGLLALMIVSGYRNIAAVFRSNTGEGTIRLAFFTITLIYSMTEAAFKVMHPVWIVFLLAVMAVPRFPATDGESQHTEEGKSSGPPPLRTAQTPPLRGWGSAEAANALPRFHSFHLRGR
jgi:exopolysaccharide production protein ExoQ